MMIKQNRIRNVLAVAALTAVFFVATGEKQAEACAFCGDYKVVGVASWDVLNVRSGPGAKYAKVGALPYNGSFVNISGECVGKWCAINFYGVKAWVNTGFLAPQ